MISYVSAVALGILILVATAIAARQWYRRDIERFLAGLARAGSVADTGMGPTGPPLEERLRAIEDEVEAAWREVRELEEQYAEEAR